MANLDINIDNVNSNLNENFIPQGFVYLSRFLFKSKILPLTPCAREIFVMLLIEATHKQIFYKGYSLKKGELLITHKQLIQKLEWNIGYRKESYTNSQVKTAMNNLRDLGLISTLNKSIGVLVTICNYAFYQKAKNYEWTYKSSDEKLINPPSTDQDVPPINKEDKNLNEDKKKNLLSEISDSDNLDYYIKTALKFWKFIQNRTQKLGTTLKSVELAECDTWSTPIKDLIENHKKTKEEIDEVYHYLSQNEFWMKVVKHTESLTKNGSNGNIHFDNMLLQKREDDAKKALPNIEELELALKLSFKNPKDHFINLFHEYQIMCRDASIEIFKGKVLDSEINNLAKLSEYDNTAAVNILRKAISKRKKVDRYRFK